MLTPYPCVAGVAQRLCNGLLRKNRASRPLQGTVNWAPSLNDLAVDFKHNHLINQHHILLCITESIYRNDSTCLLHLVIGILM